MKYSTTLTVSALMMVLLVASVSAFAISNPYWQANPLRISPGEGVKATLVLNNGGGATEAMDVSCKVVEGSDLARVVGSGSYNLPAGGRADVDIDVVVPSDSPFGARTIKISCAPVASASAGTPVVMGQAIDQTLYLSVVEKQPGVKAAAESNLVWYIVIALLVLLAIVFFTLKRKKKNR